MASHVRLVEVIPWMATTGGALGVRAEAEGGQPAAGDLDVDRALPR